MKRRGLRDRWEAEVFRSKAIGDACRVLLLAMARHMTDGGSVSIPRDQLAAVIGKHSSRVTAHIAEARQAGLLDQTGPGFRGRTACYVAVLPAPKVTGDQSPFAEKGDTPPVTFTSHLSEPSETPQGRLKVTAYQSPNAGAHVRVPYGRRETEPNHDGSRAALDRVLVDRRSNEKDPKILALAAAFACTREQGVA